MGLWNAMSNGVNYLGRKVGAGAQYVGNKISGAAQYLGNKAANIPIVGDAIKKGLDTVNSMGKSVVDAGQSLIGGRGGVGGAVNSLQDAVGKAETLINPTSLTFH